MTNQSDISADLKAHIYKTIPMPSGWQEAFTESGQPYFINHNTHMTHWEDPRIEIYTQQQKKQQSYQYKPHQMFPGQMMPAQQPVNAQPFPVAAPTFSNNQFGAPMHTTTTTASSTQSQPYNLASNFSAQLSMDPTRAPMQPQLGHQSIAHSASSNCLSQSSSNSSLSSLSSSTQELSKLQQQHHQQQQQQPPMQSKHMLHNQPLANAANGAAAAAVGGDLYVNSLRKSLDKLLDKKQTICNQLKDLCDKVGA